MSGSKSSGGWEDFKTRTHIQSAFALWLILDSKGAFFSKLRHLWPHLSRSLWRLVCIVLYLHCLTFFHFCDSLPLASHFVVLNLHKVPLDMSAVELCNFSDEEDICDWAEVRVPTRFLLKCYLLSQVLPQIFIKLRYEKDRVYFFKNCWQEMSTLILRHAWEHNFRKFLIQLG